MRRSIAERGVIIESGANDWQIFQQDANGTADMQLTGRWIIDTEHRTAEVYARVVNEDDYTEAARSLTWQPAATRSDGTWSIRLGKVPAGGLYRIETGLRIDGGPLEWAIRGDAVHHLGVGDVWMITGQSNSSGYGKTPAHDPPELGIHMFHACGEWRLAAHPLSDSTGSRYVANRENANGSHAPWLAFARKLKAALGYPIGLIPAALGGSPLNAWVRSGSGVLFENMLGYFRDSGCGGCRGAVWYQGESDAAPQQHATYRKRFEELLGDLRTELNTPDLPVITVQLNRYIGEDHGAEIGGGWEAMREVQRQIARDLDGVEIISTLDLGLSDGIHNNSSGNLVIGERCADTALGAVHGRDIKHRHPDLASAICVDARTIDLVFEHVDTRLHYESAIRGQRPFAVRDSAGDAVIEALALPAPNTVRLSLARELSGSVTIVGAPTHCPPSVVPFDICGYRPMLAFTTTLSI